MKKKNHTDPTKSSRNLKDSKYIILLLLREGKTRKEVEDTLKLSRSTVLWHIRELKEKSLVKKNGVYSYYLTPLGHEITHEEFNKLFYRAGCRVPLEIKVDKKRRFHNLFFTSYVISRPPVIPSNAVKKTLSKNNEYYTIQYESGSVKIHTQKAVLQIDDFTALNAYDGSLEVQKKLRDLIKEIEEDGFKLDKVYNASSYHIADMWHPLAQHFKTVGSKVLVDDRLIIDFSHGVPEMETIHKHTAPEDMQKWEALGKAILNSNIQNLENFGKLLRNLE